MKLLSFEHNGKASWGVVKGEGVVDLGKLSDGIAPTLRSALEQDIHIEFARHGVEREPDFALDAIRYLPVITDPQKIFCVGLNYEAHRVEANRPKTGQPAIFVRTPTSQTGHGEPLVVPAESPTLDFEGELAIIIGRGGRRIPEADAWSHIAGYAPYNDGSVREWQHHTTQWTSGKNFDATGGFGPWLVTRDEIPDNEELSLVTRLNDVEMQRATTHMMIFNIPYLIDYISRFATLLPGDVILTGTPGGVGVKRQPPVYMQAGDVVEVEIERVGVLRNPVISEMIVKTAKDRIAQE